MKFITTLALLATSSLALAEEKWIDLFNGKDLTGWTVNAKVPFKDPESQKLEDIFQVRDGVIQVYPGMENGTNQEPAVLVSDRSFSKYRLQVEYRWLKNRFQPRVKANRDSGILVHCHTYFNVWPASIEMQLGDGKPGQPYVAGDLWVLGKTRTDSPREGKFYKKGAPLMQRGGDGKDWSLRSNFTPVHADKPNGEWNLAELYVDEEKSVKMYLNGQLVNEVFNTEYLTKDKEWKPLKEGRITLQAEWAALEFRSVKVLDQSK